mgnify:CR=1 FL=1
MAQLALLFVTVLCRASSAALLRVVPAGAL